jgi:hypothetical protein
MKSQVAELLPINEIAEKRMLFGYPGTHHSNYIMVSVRVPDIVLQASQ